MAQPHEIPQLTSELFEMTKEYIRQETVEPAKALGRQAGLGIGGAMLMATGAFLLILGLFFVYRMVLPEGQWWEVLARGLTALSAALAAGLIAWRIGANSAD